MNIIQIFTDTNTGLLPYLEANLGDYRRFLLRPYNFGNASLQAGFRLRDFSETIEAPGSKATSVGILLGQMIAITDPVASQLQAAELAATIDAHVYHWGQCVCPGLSAPITNFSGSLGITQDRGISSENPNGWWAVVIRSFSISFYG